MERWDVVEGVYGTWNWYPGGNTVTSIDAICSVTVRASGWIDVQNKTIGGEDIKSLSEEAIASIFSMILKSPRNGEKSALGESDSGLGVRIFRNDEKWLWSL